MYGFSDIHSKIQFFLTHNCGTFPWWLWTIKTFIYICIWCRLRRYFPNKYGTYTRPVIGNARMCTKSFLAGIKEPPPQLLCLAIILCNIPLATLPTNLLMFISFWYIITMSNGISPSNMTNIIYTCKFAHHYTSYL